MPDNTLSLAATNGALPNHMLGLSASEVLKQATSLAKANEQPLNGGVSYLHACLQAQRVLD